MTLSEMLTMLPGVGMLVGAGGRAAREAGGTGLAVG